MADNSKIEWTDATWNPITGCSAVSVGCDNCYARRMANRLRGRFGYPDDDPFRVTFHPDRLEQPRKWRKSRRVFVCSMGDLFHEDVTDFMIESVLMHIDQVRHHTYSILTKRPERLLGYHNHLKKTVIGLKWPDNIWVGITAENQEMADKRIPVLLQIPASVRFVSIEPMLEYINLADYFSYIRCSGCGQDMPYEGYNHEVLTNSTDRFPELCGSGRKTEGLDWVPCGAETGPGARSMSLEWARDLRDQCKDEGVPFFFKSAGKQIIPDDLMVREIPN